MQAGYAESSFPDNARPRPRRPGTPPGPLPPIPKIPPLHSDSPASFATFSVLIRSANGCVDTMFG